METESYAYYLVVLLGGNTIPMNNEKALVFANVNVRSFSYLEQAKGFVGNLIKAGRTVADDILIMKIKDSFKPQIELKVKGGC